MSDLTLIEKRKLERALEMGSGYVLNFTDRTFSDFFLDSVGIDIYDKKYNYRSGSKANRMRAFWDQENNFLVGKVLAILFEEWDEFKNYNSPPEAPEECWKIVKRIQESSPVQDIDSIAANFDDRSFEVLSRSVKECIDKNEPETGLDRLHTFLVKYFRALCAKREIETDREKPLHSLVGEYIKALKNEGLIESDMTEKILKSSISVLEAFNRVRNNKSFAHDNLLLNYDESLLIFSHVTSSVRFIEAIERKVNHSRESESCDNDELPF